MPAARTTVRRPAGSPGRGIATGPWSPTAMCSSLGASASMWDGLFVAHVADGDPTKAFTWRRLSDSTNAFSASSQATYCPPIAAGQAYWRSGRN